MKLTIRAEKVAFLIVKRTVLGSSFVLLVPHDRNPAIPAGPVYVVFVSLLVQEKPFWVSFSTLVPE